MRKRPLIGIAPYIVPTKSKREMVGTYRTYLQSLEKAGAHALVLNPNRQYIPDYLKLLDGLLLTGGDDIHPKFFGQKRGRAPLELSPDARTTFEMAATKAFLKARKPILGICLGCQTLNVVKGGTLIQDLPSQRPKSDNHKKGMHPILINKRSFLRKLLGKNKAQVNTKHHQSIDRLGKGVLASALSPDGVVEAIELPQYPFVLGVQWHPEERLDTPESKKIFRAFVRASGAKK
jgi:putative glutamine amidotransferase